MAQVEVVRQPRLALLSTGDELTAPGTARDRADRIPDSVSFGVVALAEQWGGRVIDHQRVGDDWAAMKAAVETMLADADVLVVTGGASVGDKDFAKPVLAELGLEPTFSKVAIKPGKPVWFGRIGQKLVLGLPGNPTSAMVTARLFLAPLLAGLSGGEPNDALVWRVATAGASFKAAGDRETFYRAAWTGERIAPVAEQDSGAQRALADAQLIVRRRVGTPAAEPGDPIEVISF
jgi:molybdopterin molybdotransferase